MFFAPYFQIANDLFGKILFGKQFTVIPDNIESDVPLVTLYSGKRNINASIMEAIVEKTKFYEVI